MEKQNDPVAVAPLRDKEKKPKECVRHKGMTRTVVCSIDKLLLCPLCVLKHLKEAHKIDWLPAIDEALVAPPKDVQKTKEYESSIGIIRHEQNVLKFKAANIKNDKTIDQRRAEAILEIDNIVKSANVAKNEFSEKYVAASRKLDRLKLKYEGKLAKAKEDMDPWNYMDEGEEMKPTVRVDDDKDVQKEMERIMMEVKKEAEGLDKAPSPGKDELGSCIEGLKKEVIKDFCKAIELAVAMTGDTGHNQFLKIASEKKKVLEDYGEEIKRLHDLLPKMSQESQEVAMKTKEAKVKLEETMVKLKEAMKDKEEEKLLGFARCKKCKKLSCMTCSGTGAKCDACGTTPVCKDCVGDCSACAKKVCKVGCLTKCVTCGNMECLVCEKEKKCSVDNIYGNTIDLNKTDKKYFYCSCNQVWEVKSTICKYDLRVKKLTGLNITIPQYARITQIKGRIFVTGGSSCKDCN